MPTATAASKSAAAKPAPVPNGDFYQLIELRNKVARSSQTKLTAPVA